LYTQRVFDLTNQERAKAGLPALTRNADLDRAGAAWCQEMFTDGFFDHFNPARPTRGPLERAKEQGYGAGASFVTIGENIAFGFPSPSDLVTAWMNSPPHRANILNTTVKELGVGMFVGDAGPRRF